MDLIIPTCGRWQEQETLRQLVAADLRPILVVQAREVDKYERYSDVANIAVLPSAITTIAPTRQYILDNVGSSDCMIMFDDDLTFFKRRTDDPTKFYPATNSDIRAMVVWLASSLGHIAHVGIASREGGNRLIAPFLQNTRIMRVLGYFRPTLRRHHIRFDEIDVMEDFHVALTLLRLGYDNLIINSFCHNQAGSGKSGGCSHFRTKEIQEKSANRLAELHPGFVSVVKKTTKAAWGGGERTDVRIKWKAAYESSSVLDQRKILFAAKAEGRPA